jgi:hypothetical protein
LSSLAVTFCICIVVWSEAALKPVYWYVNEKTQPLIRGILDVTMPPTEPAKRKHEHEPPVPRGENR